MTVVNPQAGWYPDPSGDASKLRWWNGTEWTEDYTDAQGATEIVTSTQTGQQQDNQEQSADVFYYDNLQYDQAGFQNTGEVSSTDSTLRLVAFIFCVVGTVSLAFTIIGLAWGIPMTVHAWKIYKGQRNNTIAFGVCTLIFVNIIAGILLLVSKKDA